MTCLVVLLLTCVLLLVYEYHSYKTSLVQQASILGKLGAANGAAALSMKDSKSAYNALTLLNINEHLRAAILLDSNKKVFAKFPDTFKPEVNLARNLDDGFLFDNSDLIGIVPVEQNEERLGTLYLRMDARALQERFAHYGLIMLGVVGVALLTAYLLSGSLQKNISSPILELANVARGVSENKAYFLQTTISDPEEVVMLKKSFNQMLSEIQLQKQKIVTFNQDLEQKIHERTDELQTAYEEMEAFSYSVSHDLNAPLRHIDAYIQLYLKKKNNGLDADDKNTLHKITQNSRKAQHLIDDLLTFSHIGRDELTKSDVAMNEIVRALFTDLKKLEPERKIDLELSSVPTAFADPPSMTHVWSNLISNAIKYTRLKDKTVIKIGSENHEHYTTYFVEDNGIGFRMDEVAYLFKPFHRLNSAANFEGTGVGLAIVNRIISKHGGSTWAVAEQDKGAKFYFSIPNKKRL
jgi:signal transduction histidine kinase